jgi:hypothetical protein
MSWKSLLRPAALAVVVAVVSAYSAYWAAERQYALEHDKWLADIIQRTAVNPTNVAQGVVSYLSRAKVLQKDDEELLCWLFKDANGKLPANCPSKDTPPRRTQSN